MTTTPQPYPTRLDLLRLPILGRFLCWKHSRTALQFPLFLLAALLVIDGLFGSPLAAKNTATVGAWVHYRGLVVLALLMVGNLFCAACPFMLPRKLAKWIGKPTARWPKALRNKWLALAGFVGIVYAYELFDLWASPWWTAWLIVAYFALAFVLEAIFTRSSFCLYVCPLGTFNFLYSTASPTTISAAAWMYAAPAWGMTASTATHPSRAASSNSTCRRCAATWTAPSAWTASRPAPTTTSPGPCGRPARSWWPARGPTGSTWRCWP